jgi:hypothetical protein
VIYRSILMEELICTAIPRAPLKGPGFELTSSPIVVRRGRHYDEEVRFTRFRSERGCGGLRNLRETCQEEFTLGTGAIPIRGNKSVVSNPSDSSFPGDVIDDTNRLTWRSMSLRCFWASTVTTSSSDYPELELGC